MKLGAAALLALSALVLGTTIVQAHSASDAYLNLTVDGGNRRGMFVVHGQWDIALRDLDFVLKLDDDGDGRLSWGEVRHHQAAIARTEPMPLCSSTSYADKLPLSCASNTTYSLPSIPLTAAFSSCTTAPTSRPRCCRLRTMSLTWRSDLSRGLIALRIRQSPTFGQRPRAVGGRHGPRK
jgi:hypothetical protein